MRVSPFSSVPFFLLSHEGGAKFLLSTQLVDAWTLRDLNQVLRVRQKGAVPRLGDALRRQGRFAQVGPDGRTANFRLRGREYRRPLPPFSEVVHFQLAANAASRLQDRWSIGIFSGLVARSSKFWIGTPMGFVQARSIRRLPLEERSSGALMNQLIGNPWLPKPGESDVVIPTIVHADPIVPASELPPVPPAAVAPPTRRNRTC